MKIVHFVLAALFFLFAYFQLNDPDPILWVAIYGMTAILFLLSGLGKSYPGIDLIMLGACLHGLIRTAPGLWDYITNQDGYTIMQGMSYDKPYIEETREFGGLLIAAIALYFLYKQSTNKK